MVALSHVLSSIALLAGGAAGAGQLSSCAKEEPSAESLNLGKQKKECMIGGVLVKNCDLAYGGGDGSRLPGPNREEDWMFILKGTCGETEVQRLCDSAGGVKCQFAGKRVPVLKMRGTEVDVEAVIKSAEGAEHNPIPGWSRCQVELIEPEQKMYAIPGMAEDADDALTAQSLWGLARINAAARPVSGNGVTVFVLDTGVRTTHQDFGGRAIPTLDMSSGSAVECDGDTSCAGDSQGHGTHCAGTAAGTTYGVAPGATIRSMKVLGDDGSGSFAWGISAIDWMVTSNIRPAVASMSLGATVVYSPMATAINTATDAGVTVVVAGGNENRDACDCTPAHVPSALTIGSTTASQGRSYFSNYGTCTDMWAPGSSIQSAGHTSDTAQKTMSGTSMACPHVSGGAALVLEQSPTFKADQVLSKLLADAWTDTITGLMAGDTNEELYVGSDAPPSQGGVAPTPAPPTPVPAPTPAPVMCPEGGELENPDRDGDCRCSLSSGQEKYCWHKGIYGDCPAFHGTWRHNTWFQQACGADCVCKDVEPICEILINFLHLRGGTKRCGPASGGVCWGTSAENPTRMPRYCTSQGACSDNEEDAHEPYAAYSNNFDGACDCHPQFIGHAVSARGSLAMTIGLLLWGAL